MAQRLLGVLASDAREQRERAGRSLRTPTRADTNLSTLAVAERLAESIGAR